MKSLALILFLAVLLNCAVAKDPKPTFRSGLPSLPSSMPLADYEKDVLYPWLFSREYASADSLKAGWKADTAVRDTGPFVMGNYYGTHPAVRIHYSPEIVRWIAKGRKAGKIPNGAVIVKEMFTPPAAIYATIKQSPSFQGESGEELYEDLLPKLMTSGWTVMIKDTGGDSKDGWFWSGPSPPDSQYAKHNVDDYKHVRTSGFGLGTCIRCHASAKTENTFSSKSNYDPRLEPLRFKTDNSWRASGHLSHVMPLVETFWSANDLPPYELTKLKSQLVLPPSQHTSSAAAGLAGYISSHSPDQDTVVKALSVGALKKPNADFVETFKEFTELSPTPPKARITAFSLPEEFADHVYPGPDPQEYFTSSNCYGCHGGLGGSSSGVAQFVSTDPTSYGAGYNISPYGEWRWSPMGLAGRDPIFHSQIETEMIILLEENKQLRNGKPADKALRKTQQALLDTCLRCHGAMGLRQKGLDPPPKDGNPILDPDFDINLFYIDKPLTKKDSDDPPYKPPANLPFPPHELNYADWKYGDLAREGISCAICHNIAPPNPATARSWAADQRKEHPKWLPSSTNARWSDPFFYFLANNNTGLFERAPDNQLYGPFDDVVTKPMENALGITPLQAPSVLSLAKAEKLPLPPKTPFTTTPMTKGSAMCGACHSINLPNIGATEDKFPILTELEPNKHFRGIPHSIEQATYLEWLNSKFGPGKHNRKGPEFQSCQDCHMPNRFATVDDVVPEIDQIAAQIATIQDANYAQVEEALPPEDIIVKTRPDYRRHEMVGLNGFMVEMFEQFPGVLGVSTSDYESGAKNGAQFAIENMQLSVEEGRVATIAVTSARVSSGKLVVDVNVANKVGHRFPSGVTFRRVWVELLVMDQGGHVLWSSGRTNGAGVIVDNHGKPLPTELLDGGTITVNGKQVNHQPHYQTITNDDQVQIYEELTQNKDRKFTTSFVHRVFHVKDNRLLPEGWVPAAEFAGKSPDAGVPDQGDLLEELMEATNSDVTDDPDFTSSPGKGKDNLAYEIALASDGKLGGATPALVQATVYSQAFMPAWFYQRFALANEAKAAGYSTPSTDRLFYIASNLNLEGTVMEDWKFKVTTTGPKEINGD